MNRKWIRYIGLWLCIWLVPSLAVAHTHLKQSTPGDGETVSQPVQKITLVFEERIEQGGSVELHDGAGHTVKPASVKVQGDTLEATLGSALPAGHYTAQWKIIGLDGHPMQGSFQFEVKADQTSAGQKLSKAPNQQPAPHHNQHSAPAKKSASSPVIWVVALLVLSAAVIAGWLFRRKPKA
ncbi:copper resistance protein CopC [Polycladomyces sp. WAk]|uniref:Copper resistance protein CopC n=1 Tax=Polycladomyces zharkentensis TaxID=2807616 RepID=A0ABS2WIN7_9BACL|nr:copper resistance protein CopC [Polycladomyces sp. WAk]